MTKFGDSRPNFQAKIQYLRL